MVHNNQLSGMLSIRLLKYAAHSNVNPFQLVAFFSLPLEPKFIHLHYSFAQCISGSPTNFKITTIKPDHFRKDVDNDFRGIVVIRIHFVEN